MSDSYQLELLAVIATLQQEIRVLSKAVVDNAAATQRQAKAIEAIAEMGAVLQPREEHLQSVAREFLDIKEAAKRRGISTKTLRRALKNGAADLAGGPVDATPTSKRRSWRFDASTLDAWWERWGASRTPAKKTRSRATTKTKAAPTTRRKKSARVDWAAASRGE